MTLLARYWTMLGPFTYLPIVALLLAQAARSIVETILVLWGLATRDVQRRAYCERHLAGRRSERMESRRLRRVKCAADHGPYMRLAVDSQAAHRVTDGSDADRGPATS